MIINNLKYKVILIIKSKYYRSINNIKLIEKIIENLEIILFLIKIKNFKHSI